MNLIDTEYQDLLCYILGNGVEKETRNSKTLSIFGWQIRHNMKDGFPLLTTKKMYFKGIVTELLWFLRGDTNIKYLVDNGCHIWDGDCYANYEKHTPEQYVVGSDSDPMRQCMVWKRKTDSSSGYPILERLSKEEFINKIKTDDKFASKWGELGPIYGKQWRSWEKCELTNDDDFGNNESWGDWNINQIDQIANLISELKTNPDSRRLMVNAWNVGELDQMVLPPCHYGFQVYTRELSEEERWRIRFDYYPKDKQFPWDRMALPSHRFLDDFNIPRRAISLMWNQRSVDTFLGLPFNIASYGLLLEIIAKEVNMVPDDLIGNLGDVHLYTNHIEQAKEQIGREPFELPRLNFNTEWWDKSFIEAVMSDDFCKCLLEEDIQLSNYQSHPAIKAPLSN
jgi:thymidylate synthase